MSERTRRTILTVCGLALLAVMTVMAAPAEAQVTPNPAMLRTPDVSQSHIVFVYADDLWLVPREGGMAAPLASPPGMELFPRFSPDGKTIAFVGNYDGGRDIYTVGVSGGIPYRLTHHPAGEVVTEWTPDGDVLFFTNGFAGLPRQLQLFKVSADGGLPEQLPVPYGTWASISDDGEWLAYTPHTRDQRTWKRYMGGMATDVWLFNLKDNTSKPITDWDGTDSQPMWHGDKVYYMSDGGDEHRLNIWVHDTKSGKNTQVTKYEDYDVKWPSIGPGAAGEGEIVYQNGSKLYLLSLDSEEAREIEVTIPGARPTIRTRSVDASKFIQSWDISPTGKRATMSARGDIWTAPAEKGSPRNLTRSNGTAERYPSWSPDGRWIAYFSDDGGEYELFVTQSDGKGETKQVTKNGKNYNFSPLWAPDSKKIAFTDQTGAFYLHDLESEETKKFDKDPFSGDFSGGGLSWSHDSRWLTYTKASDEGGLAASVYIYSVEEGESRPVTSDMFNDSSPTFDRKGNYLFFSSNRTFSPHYSDIDTTFIYTNTEVLLAVPLRADQKSPWAPESDEESWKDDKDDEEGEDDDKKEGGGADEKGGGDDAEEAATEAVDDGLSGTWEGSATAPELPPGGMPFTLNLIVAPDGSLSGSISVPNGSGSIDAGSLDKSTGAFTMSISADDGTSWEVSGTISGQSMTATATNTTVGLSLELTASRSASAAEGGGGDGGDDAKKDDKAREVVEIDFDGFESRAVMIPVKNGRFGNIVVNDKNQLIYARLPVQGSDGQAEIKLFDLKDEKKQEKDVAKGSAAFTISADGKKLLIVRGNSGTIQKAASGDSGKPVVTKGMMTSIDPREEWAQLLRDAWRLQRDFFYDPDLHGVDWDQVYEDYSAMLDDCATRRDVGFVIAEMIAELNVGHAYYFGGDFNDDEPQMGVGMLGADYELADGAYRIRKIYHGAPWDADARGPLSQPGVDVKQGDYLLAVNGSPIDTSRDPWAAFLGMAGQVITITVSEKPTMDEDAREVILTPLQDEGNLRYRAWIERNRARVEAETDGRAGYIYVPNTGVNGQNDLFRQFYGQIGKPALIIDERWNGGGQIPTRFIELLNRPVTNYWARPHGKDWPWPPDSHQGPKAMLINGMAGSGGDAFPAYFRQAGLGKLIGMRTWGGLVGISGNPQLIDGGIVTVPTFGYYEKDGTWGIEGHGVEPDIEVVDDPALMVDGGDPQLDAAIEHIMGELRRNPYVAPEKPKYPNRSGMGITAADK